MDNQPTTASSLDEGALVAAAQRDPRQFGELFLRNGARVYGFIAKRVRNRSEAEDLTSEVFHQALRNIRQYQWRGVPFAAWLFRIALNAIAQRGRDAARERGTPLHDAEPVSDGDAERCALLLQLVDRLPADQCRVIVLRYTEQQSMREIAALMERSEAAVKQLHYRALENLRKSMEGDHE